MAGITFQRTDIVSVLDASVTCDCHARDGSGQPIQVSGLRVIIVQYDNVGILNQMRLRFALEQSSVAVPCVSGLTDPLKEAAEGGAGGT